MQNGVAGVREQSQLLVALPAPASSITFGASEFGALATGAFGGVSEMGLVCAAASPAGIVGRAGGGVGFSAGATV